MSKIINVRFITTERVKFDFNILWSSSEKMQDYTTLEYVVGLPVLNLSTSHVLEYSKDILRENSTCFYPEQLKLIEFLIDFANNNYVPYTRKQEFCIQQVTGKHPLQLSIQKALDALQLHGLISDRGFTYGCGKLYKPIPSCKILEKLIDKVRAMEYQRTYFSSFNIITLASRFSTTNVRSDIGISKDSEALLQYIKVKFKCSNKLAMGVFALFRSKNYPEAYLNYLKIEDVYNWGYELLCIFNETYLVTDSLDEAEKVAIEKVINIYHGNYLPSELCTNPSIDPKRVIESTHMINKWIDEAEDLVRNNGILTYIGAQYYDEKQVVFNTHMYIFNI